MVIGHVMYINQDYNKFIMISSSSANRSMQSSLLRRSLKPEQTNYIPNQSSSDQQLSKVLDLLSQFNSSIELKQMEKGKKAANFMEKQLAKMDHRHRSYLKAKNLVYSSLAIMQICQNNLPQAQILLQIQQNTSKSLSTPQYLSKSHLITLLYLHKKSQASPTSPIYNEIKKTYRKFWKIKFPSSHMYYNSKLWEELKIVEIVVYQFVLVVQMLEDLCEEQADALYYYGLRVAKKVLGKDHKFVELMTKITNLRRKTNKLITTDDQPILRPSSSLGTRINAKPILYGSLQNPEAQSLLHQAQPEHNATLPRSDNSISKSSQLQSLLMQSVPATNKQIPMQQLQTMMQRSWKHNHTRKSKYKQRKHVDKYQMYLRLGSQPKIKNFPTSAARNGSIYKFKNYQPHRNYPEKMGADRNNKMTDKSVNKSVENIKQKKRLIIKSDSKPTTPKPNLQHTLQKLLHRRQKPKNLHLPQITLSSPKKQAQNIHSHSLPKPTNQPKPLKATHQPQPQPTNLESVPLPSLNPSKQMPMSQTPKIKLEQNVELELPQLPNEMESPHSDANCQLI